MIFAGGYNLKKKDFGRNITVILMFAVVGTIVNFLITFALTYLISHFHLIETLRDTTHVEELETSLIEMIERNRENLYHDRNAELHGSLDPVGQRVLLSCRPVVARHRPL